MHSIAYTREEWIWVSFRVHDMWLLAAVFLSVLNQNGMPFDSKSGYTYTKKKKDLSFLSGSWHMIVSNCVPFGFEPNGMPFEKSGRSRRRDHVPFNFGRDGNLYFRMHDPRFFSLQELIEVHFCFVSNGESWCWVEGFPFVLEPNWIVFGSKNR